MVLKAFGKHDSEQRKGGLFPAKESGWLVSRHIEHLWTFFISFIAQGEEGRYMKVAGKPPRRLSGPGDRFYHLN